MQRTSKVKVRKIFASLAFFTFVIDAAAFAQPVPNVPDLSKWTLTGESDTSLRAQDANGVSVVVTKVARYYEINDLKASVLLENGKEVAMYFLTDPNTLWFALKVDNKWHVAKKSGGGTVKTSVVTDGRGTLTGLKLSLETVNGMKEVVLSLN